MADLVVAALSLDVAWENPPENFKRADALVADAVSEGARFLVLPEMFATGFTMNAAQAASYARETLDYLKALARRTDAFVLAGFIEPADPRPFNTAVLLAPDGGECLRYRKIHPFTPAGEHEFYQSGDDVRVADVAGVRVAPLICYDLRFPEVFRRVADVTDLFVVIANWPAERRDAWMTLLAARAIENQAFVLGVNRTGEGNDLSYAGDSLLADPSGRFLVHGRETPCAVTGVVSPAAVAFVRERLPHLRNRRLR